jgi:hypothetical protein
MEENKEDRYKLLHIYTQIIWAVMNEDEDTTKQYLDDLSTEQINDLWFHCREINNLSKLVVNKKLSRGL